MMMHFPAEIISKCLRQNIRAVRHGHDDMMLETFAADVAHELLQFRHAGHGAITEGFQFVVGQLAFTDVGADFALGIGGGDASVSQRAGGRATVQRAVGIFDADGRANDGRVGDFDVGQE